jgi:hypothetical protein
VGWLHKRHRKRVWARAHTVSCCALDEQSSA